MEPINGRGVDESWELTSTESESITNRGEAETHVEVLTDLVNEEVHEVLWSVKDTHRLGFTSDLAQDAIKFIRSEKLRNVTSRQNIVDVDKEFVVNNL
jgi:hypothetical protein